MTPELEQLKALAEDAEPVEIALNVNNNGAQAADAFWRYWKENGETHRHGYYESTWGAINRALRVSGVVPHVYKSAKPTSPQAAQTDERADKLLQQALEALNDEREFEYDADDGHITAEISNPKTTAAATAIRTYLEELK